MKSKKIIVTGADGYIGSTLIHYLIRLGYKPIALFWRQDSWDFPSDIDIRSGDLDNDDFLSDALADIDIIFHLAGIKGYDKCIKEVHKAAKANIYFTDRIIKSLGKRQAKIIFLSTYWVYGHKSPIPFREDIVLSPSEPYGWSKALAEQLIKNSGFNYTIVRLGNIFGYGAGKGYEEIASLFLERALQGQSILLRNAGKHCIDLICIDDVCRILGRIIELENKNLILNVGNGKPISILKLAHAVNKVSMKVTGNKAKIIKEKRGDNKILFTDRWMDITRLKSLINYTPVPLEVSLEKFAKNLLSRRNLLCQKN